MKWRDSTLILGYRKFGESGLILSVLGSDMGRQAGLVAHGAARQTRPLLEAGNVAICEWTGRLEAHLGRFNIADVTQTNAGLLLHRPLALKGLAAVTALLRTCTDEGDRGASCLYEPTLALLALMREDEGDAYWPAAYARWEYNLLESLGFALDLDHCAISGAEGHLPYISPRSGRGVTEIAAVQSGYLGKLLRLPIFLMGYDAAIEAVGSRQMVDVMDALKLTGHFLQVRQFDGVHQGLPEPRRALVGALAARGRVLEAADAEAAAGFGLGVNAPSGMNSASSDAIIPG